MNFGEKFLKAMRAIYDKPKARIKLNNSRLNYIPINHGTRQGCPISPLLFALCIEPLANDTNVTNNPFCTTTLKIWDKWKTKLTGKKSSLFPLPIFSGFPKDLWDIISIRKATEIHTLRDITKMGTFYQR